MPRQKIFIRKWAHPRSKTPFAEPFASQGSDPGNGGPVPWKSGPFPPPPLPSGRAAGERPSRHPRHRDTGTLTAQRRLLPQRRTQLLATDFLHSFKDIYVFINFCTNFLFGRRSPNPSPLAVRQGRGSRGGKGLLPPELSLPRGTGPLLFSPKTRNFRPSRSARSR